MKKTETDEGCLGHILAFLVSDGVLRVEVPGKPGFVLIQFDDSGMEVDIYRDGGDEPVTWLAAYWSELERS